MVGRLAALCARASQLRQSAHAELTDGSGVACALRAVGAAGSGGPKKPAIPEWLQQEIAKRKAAADAAAAAKARRRSSDSEDEEEEAPRPAGAPGGGSRWTGRACALLERMLLALLPPSLLAQPQGPPHVHH